MNGSYPTLHLKSAHHQTIGLKVVLLISVDIWDMLLYYVLARLRLTILMDLLSILTARLHVFALKKLFFDSECFAFQFCAFLICELALHHTGYPVAAFWKLTHYCRSQLLLPHCLLKVEVQVFWSNIAHLIGKVAIKTTARLSRGPKWTTTNAKLPA